MPSFFRMARTLTAMGYNENDGLFQEQLECLARAQKVVEVIKLWQEMCQLGRIFTIRDIKRAVWKVGEIEGHFSPRWIRWCICNCFDMESNCACDFYGCYRLKDFWPAPLFFVNTDQIPLPRMNQEY